MDYTQLPARKIERLARHVPPGGWAIERAQPLSTLLGSCVAVCLFDPQARLGGINHFMLPSMKRSQYGEVDSLLAGDFAMEALLNALLQQGARKRRLQAKAFGGGTIINSELSIGLRNVDFTREWLAREAIPLLASDFLGPWLRKVLFLPGSGAAYCRRMESNMVTAAAIDREERAYAEALKANSGKTKIEIF